MPPALLHRSLVALAGALALAPGSPGAGSAGERAGDIAGSVVDRQTKTPLVAANVLVEGTRRGAVSGPDGRFSIANVPVGSYSLVFRYMGYEPVRKTDVVVKSGRITAVHAELRVAVIEKEAVEVTGGYFDDAAERPAGAVGFSYEEIRRAPGSAGDVSRIIMGLPSVAKVDDQRNSLIVRGGSPTENAFFIDNIEVPNINHFPFQGTSMGPISLVNVDFIENVDFYSGGFPPRYGDRLSSVMDISFREGNRSELDGQVDLSFAGLGAVFEGPLPASRGSWLVSARRSYVDVLVDVADVGATVAPTFGDYQGKVVWDAGPDHRMLVLGVFGDDQMHSDRQQAEENDMIYFGDQDVFEGTYGLTWRSLWGRRGYSVTSLSHTWTDYQEDFFETGSELQLIRNRSVEQGLTLRNVTTFRITRRCTCEFGMEARRLHAAYDNIYAEYTGALGDTVPELVLKDTIAAGKLGGFCSLTWTPVSFLTATVGVRADYFSLSENAGVSPRVGVSWSLSDVTSLRGAAGRYSQALPLLLLAQNEANRDLQEPGAIHVVLGVDHLLNESARLSVEVYDKEYEGFPMDPAQPGLFMIDELYYRYGYFFNHEELVDRGRACSRGIEAVVQKKLASDFYGLAGASLFRSRYRDLDGRWRDRVFDNRVLFSIEGGYKPSSRWELSLRWIYAGGVPYTPFDVEASHRLNRGVLDESRINEKRYPDYHSLNLRFDRRWHFGGANLILYVSVWNAYDRRNVASHYWNQTENRQDTIYQWGLLPVFGLEFEF